MPETCTRCGRDAKYSIILSTYSASASGQRQVRFCVECYADHRAWLSGDTEKRRRGRPCNSPARDERTRREREQWAATVRQLRAALGVTQAELAERFEVDVQTVSRWERAIVSPRPDLRREIERLAEGTNRQQS